jgi:hypothetical protein
MVIFDNSNVLFFLLLHAPTMYNRAIRGGDEDEGSIPLIYANMEKKLKLFIFV